jgi:VanZ family protein
MLWVWGPVAVSLGLIILASGEIGSNMHSDVWMWRAVHQWLPWLFGTGAASSATPTFLPVWVRKLAHVAEYAVLGLVVVRALQLSGRSPGASSAPGRLDRAGPFGAPVVVIVGFCFCVVVGILDELHQSTHASRTGSPRDVVIDAFGATVGLVVGWLVWRGASSAVDLPADGDRMRLPRGG